jgi:hypothetical protein
MGIKWGVDLETSLGDLVNRATSLRHEHPPANRDCPRRTHSLDSECAGLRSKLKVAAPVGMPSSYASGRSRCGQCGKAGEDEFHRSAQEPKPRPRHLLAETKAVDHVGRQLIDPAEG